MFALPVWILAVSILPSLTPGTPVDKVALNPFLQHRSGSTYRVYSGNGEVSEGWPAISDWVSDFDTMFTNNKAIMRSSCAQWNVPNNSDNEISVISTSIQSVAKSSSIDPRFIFAIMMEESNGCVRAPTTNNGVRNPGLMQSHNGAGTCNDGNVQDPCPSNEMTQMIQDGASGTSSGDGLKQCLAEANTPEVSQYYKAARIYNSGSIDKSDNLGAGIATHCYVSNIANRLTGWSPGPSGCNPGTTGDLNGSPPASSSNWNTSSILNHTEAIFTPVAASASSTPSATSSSPASRTTTVNPSTSGVLTPGAACAAEGVWNCIGGTSFQRCASGVWSVVEEVSAGTECVIGQSSAISIAITS